jgi:hypothetical protein
MFNSHFTRKSHELRLYSTLKSSYTISSFVSAVFELFFFRSFWLSAIQKKVTSQYRPLPSAFLATMDKRTVGCLGGGQLGRMMVYAAHRLGVRMCVLDPLGEHSPAGQVSELSVKGGWAKNNGWARPVLWRITMHKGMQYIYIYTHDCICICV